MSAGATLWRYILRRFLAALPLLIGVIVLTFVMVRLAPGDPVVILVGEAGATPEFRAQALREFGLDKPVSEQLAIYLQKVSLGDLGFSYYYRQPVLRVIVERIPATLLLTGTALIFAALLGVVLGVTASRRPYSLLDNTSTTLSLFGYSMPVFWLGLMFILIFSVALDLLPAQGIVSLRQQEGGFAYVLDVASHLILPALTLGTIQLAIYTRLTRASMLEQLGQDYVVTARAKGVPERAVVFRHALRNALLPVVTITGLNIGRLISGTVLVETVFGWPGLGRLTFEAILARDYPVLTGMFIFVAIAVVIANLVTDIFYAVLDPRIRYR